jgi:dual specificity tyrosine-phosphorylation-regulated kinase 2/3/4
MIMEVRGIPPDSVLEQSTRKKIFFDPNTDEPILTPNSRGKLRMPESKSLHMVLQNSSPSFIDFIERCLEWDPRHRISPLDALQHEWIIEGLPPKVLLHH